MKIIHVPIERIPTRYTADWVEQFEKAFKKNKIKFETIEGGNEIPIEVGSVLDAYGTNIYKLEQLQTIIKKIQNNEIQDEDIIFFADLWFPGIESLFYIRNMLGKKFKIAGVFHAGTWDPYDFTSRNGMRHWGQHLENSWLNAIDVVFVATQFHKDLIVMNSNDFNPDKIFVTGIPFYSELIKQKYPIQSKENIVVFPHRLEDEKHPEKFDALKKKYPKWTFIKTLESTKNREEYFQLLARSKVMISFADQETFGYSTVESMALGNHVIVPNRLSYREIVPDENRYNKDKEVGDMLDKFMASEEVPEYPDLVKWEGSINKMIKVMKVKIKEAQRQREQEEADGREEQLRIEKERQERKEKQAQDKAKREMAKLVQDSDANKEE